MFPTKSLQYGNLNTLAGLGYAAAVGTYGRPFLVTGGGTKHAVFLGDEHSFETFEVDGGCRWSGLLFPSIEIEVDPQSAYDVAKDGYLRGAILICKDVAAIVALKKSAMWRDTLPISLDGRKIPENSQAAGFRSWRIVTTVGQERRTVFSIDVPPVAE